jgi:4'-phosphopantetheinyl transferase EntD
MWSYRTHNTLVACGIDSEQKNRLLPWKNEPPPFIFSPKEIAYYANHPEPLTGLCFSFCCKEAVFKALKEPFNFIDCELFWDSVQPVQNVILTIQLKNQFHIKESIAYTEIRGDEECVAAVYLFC